MWPYNDVLMTSNSHTPLNTYKEKKIMIFAENRLIFNFLEKYLDYVSLMEFLPIMKGNDYYT